MKDSGVQQKKYKGLSHDEIIQLQRKKIRDAIRGSTQTIDLKLNEPPERGSVEKIQAYTRGWEIEEGIEKEVAVEIETVPSRETKVETFEKKLGIHDFRLGGLGESGRGCGEIVASEINIGEEEDGVYGIRYHPTDCLRIQCPNCYSRWALERTFDIVLRIEAMALIKNERPYHVIFSVPPSDCENWTWTNINDRLWKRGVRHLRRVRCQNAGDRDHKIGDCPDCQNLTVEEYAGIGIFHPLRVREKWKQRWNANPDPDDFDNLIDSGKFWKKIRYSIANGLGTLSEYAKLGYHSHNWIFNDKPHKHKDSDFLVRYLEEGGEFKRFSRKEVVAFTRYLLTHTCVINEKTTYTAHKCEHCGHIIGIGDFRCFRCGRGFVERVEVVQNRIVHPVRSFGMLLRFDPKRELIRHFGKQKGRLLYDLLAREICSYLVLEEVEDGDDITLEWDPVEEEFFYPALHRNSAPTKGENWISIWKVFDLLIDDEFTSQLSEEEFDFLEDLADYLKIKGKPPPLKKSSHVPCAKLFYVPDTISVDAPEGDKDSEYYSLSNFRLQEKILRLIDRGESDIWKLDICIPENDLGDILKVVNRLVGLGVVEDDSGELQLNYAEQTPGELTVEEYRAAVSDISIEIVRLIRSGISDYDYLRSHFPSVPTYRFSNVLDKLLEDGTIIKQPDGELLLGG